jgi:hypothetical protein
MARKKREPGMPHLFTNRKRLHNLKLDLEHAAGHFRWESINTAVYCLGGLIFTAGSVLFLPAFDRLAAWGAWAFIIGSFLYLLVTVHDLLESLYYLRAHGPADGLHRAELASAGVYVSGTVLFIIGSFLFLPALYNAAPAAWCFIVGSGLFAAGASLNVVRIVRAPTMLIMQLFNATAICFIVGSVLFLTASVPYLWAVQNHSDRIVIFTYTGWEYIIGSGLFLAGGLLNYYRASRVMRRRRGSEAENTG